MKQAKRIPALPALVQSVLLALSVLSSSPAVAGEKGAPWPPGVQQALERLKTYEYGQPRKPLATLELFIAKATGDAKLKSVIAARLGELLADPQTTIAAKRFICEQLLIVGNDSHVPTLVKMLDDPKTAEMARQALEGIPGEASLAALRDALAKLKGKALVGVINSLGVRRDEKSIAPLVERLRGEELQVAAAAAEALGRIGSAEAAEALTAAKPRKGLEAIVFEAKLRCAERLVAGRDPRTGLAIYWKIPLGADTSAHRGLAAMSGMARAGEDQALPVFLRILAARSAHPHVRAHALRLAAKMPGQDVTVALARKLAELEPKWQAALIDVLAERGDRTAAPHVARLVGAKDAAVQLAALRALGSLGDAASVVLLARLAAAKTGLVEQAARSALARLTGPGVDEALLAAAAKGDAAVRVQVIRAVATRRTATATPVLLGAAADPDEKVRVAAFGALAVVAGPADYPRLVGLLVVEKSPSAAGAAERAVLAVGGRVATEAERAKPVLAALDAAPAPAKRSLLRVLSGVGGEDALGAVRRHLAHSEPTVRDAAVRALAKWPDASATGDLLKLARESKNATHRRLALRGYLRMAQAAAGADRLKMLENVRRLATTTDAKRMLLASLAGTTDAGALEVAAGFLDDRDVHAEAALATLKLGKALLRGDRLAVKDAMSVLLEKSKDEAVLKQARALHERASKAPASSAQQHAALRPNKKRSDAQRKALAKRAPKGYHLACYLDCGPDRADGVKGGPTLRLVDGQAYAWAAGAAAADQLRFLTIFFAGQQVVFEASGLNPKKAYQLGFSWWDRDHNTRAQSVWVSAGKAGRSTKLLGKTKLPPGAAKPPEEKTLPLPRQLTVKGAARIVFRNEGSPNCVVSEVWLWESDAESEVKMPAPRKKGGTPVVILTGIDYPGHKWRQTAPVLADLLLQDPRLDVEVVEDPSFVGSPKLHGYKVCVLHMMNWQVPDPPAAALENLRKFVADGGGLVLVHFACGAFQQWPEFVKIAGRVWDPKLRGHDPYGKFRVDMTDAKHAITAGLKPFETTDELYTCLDGKTPITVLAQATSKVDKKDYPIAFVLPYGKGRVFHCPLGHNVQAFEAPSVGELFRRGSAWAAGLPPVPEATEK